MAQAGAHVSLIRCAPSGIAILAIGAPCAPCDEPFLRQAPPRRYYIIAAGVAKSGGKGIIPTVALMKEEGTVSVETGCEPSSLFRKVEEAAYELTGARIMRKGLPDWGKGYGGVYARSEPEGAKIIVDGVEMDGVAPLTLDDMPGGDHIIAAGYPSRVKEVSLKQFERFDLYMPLSAAFAAAVATSMRGSRAHRTGSGTYRTTGTSITAFGAFGTDFAL